MLNIRRATLALLQMLCVLATAGVGSSAAHAATASWDANTESNIAGYKLSYGTQPGVHTVTIDVGNVTTYTFNPPAGMRYYVVVQAYNKIGELSEKSAEVTLDVPLPNRAPILTQPASQTSYVDANVWVALTASDPDGTPLQFSAIGLPPGISIDSASGVISGIAMAAGTYVTTVFVSDGSLAAGAAFLWTVIDNAAVVDLYPVDTTLMMNTENTSAANWLATLTWPANRAASAILMKFNLAQIPANAVIQSAVLNLFLTSTDGNSAEPNYTVSLHQIVNRNPDISRANGYAANMFSMWTPNQCCFNGVPMAQADISPARSLTAVNQAAGYKTWDAAAVVRAWVSTPASNYGLLLNADTTKDLGRFRTFASMQDAVASRRPFLRVRYTVSSASASRALVQDTSVRISADFDGDGSLDLSTYRPSTGEWRIWTSSSNFIAHTTTLWGEPGDVAVPADYDGDHRADLAVFRPASGDWHIWLSKTNQPLLVHWGGAGHQPVALDHDGDGKADLGIIRKGHSAILLSSTSYSTSVTFR